MDDFLLRVLTLVLFVLSLTLVTILEKKAAKRHKP